MIGIVAHTSRLDQANTLADKVNATYISVDDGTLGCNGNHKKVWAHLSEQHTEWSILLEDDAIPVDGFIDQAQQALAVTPGHVVSFYLGRHHIPTLDWEQRKQRAIAQADSNEAHWLTTNHLLHAVAVAIPTQQIPSMWHHINKMPDVFPIDEAITHWAYNTGRTVAYTWPSLIDHADQPTTFRHPDKMPRPPGRIAYRTGTHTHWTDKAVTM
jgi:hypothetical protein